MIFFSHINLKGREEGEYKEPKNGGGRAGEEGVLGGGRAHVSTVLTVLIPRNFLLYVEVFP
jgi:hypothetical protein